MSAYICYCLRNTRVPPRTYVGITNNMEKRLRQHNGELSGGARSTAGHGPWHVVWRVEGFEDRRHALQFEWRLHHPSLYGMKRGSGEEWRRQLAEQCLAREERFKNLRLS